MRHAATAQSLSMITPSSVQACNACVLCCDPCLPFGLQASATATASCFSQSSATAVAQSFAQAASTAQGGFCAVAPIFAQSVATAIAAVRSVSISRPQTPCIACCQLAVESCMSDRHGEAACSPSCRVFWGTPSALLAQPSQCQSHWLCSHPPTSTACSFCRPAQTELP